MWAVCPGCQGCSQGKGCCAGCCAHYQQACSTDAMLPSACELNSKDAKVGLLTTRHLPAYQRNLMLSDQYQTLRKVCCAMAKADNIHHTADRQSRLCIGRHLHRHCLLQSRQQQASAKCSQSKQGHYARAVPVGPKNLAALCSACLPRNDML